jgi:hypothetical protein
MKTQEILNPEWWAETTFGQRQLKDMRRTRRAVTAATHMAEDPAASLPAQAQSWKEGKAVYRLLDEPDVTFDALMQPHWQQTRQRMDLLPLVLLVQDTTDLDFSHRGKMSGLGHKARSTTWSLSWTHLEWLPPRHDPRLNKLSPLPVWVIRVWEEGTPEGEEPIEGILLTSVPTTTLEQAWERVDWYRARWRGEDYHPCLKTGCRIEERQLQSTERLIRLLSPLAVRLLQWRDLSRQAPERPAQSVIEPETLTVLATHVALSPSSMTVGTFWTEVARMGGYLARRGDGPPGWKTLWKGWLHLQALLEGVHLAFHLRL